MWVLQGFFAAWNGLTFLFDVIMPNLTNQINSAGNI